MSILNNNSTSFGLIGNAKNLISSGKRLFGSGGGLSQAELEANAFTAKEAELNREFSALEAQKVRDENRFLSNSSISRAVADARSVGLNPYFALDSGAPVVSSPSASSPTAYSTAPKRETASMTAQMQLFGTALMVGARLAPYFL